MDYFTRRNKEMIGARIREKKKELEILVSLNGFTNNQVVKCSQELDKLIYNIQILDRSETC